MRWISEKTGVAVSQVEPNAVVRLEIDGAVAAGDFVRVIEEPELALRHLLRRLGRNTRRPVTTLRWDPSASVAAGGVRTEPWHAVHLPPAETVTRLVARVGKRESPPLFVGGPVQVTFTETLGYDGKLGAPVVPAVDASVGAQRGQTRALSGTAYGAIDPRIRIEAVLPGDDLFAAHIGRAILETSVRFRVTTGVLANELEHALRAFGETGPVTARSVDMVVEEGATHEFRIHLSNVPPHPFPLLLVAFDLDSGLMSMSDLGVAVPT